MAGKTNERDDAKLLRMVYDDLIKIADVIYEKPDNPKLIDSFDSLLTTYFDIQDDGF